MAARVREGKDRPPYNPEMLRWARDAAGVSLEHAARRVAVKPEVVAAWEALRPEQAPTVRQARSLADMYGVGFLEFFKSAPPRPIEPQHIPDFRLFASVPDPSEDQGLKSIQLWAEAQRENALDLFAEIGEVPITVPDAIFASVGEPAEDAAARIRSEIEFPLTAQVGRKRDERYKIPVDFRRRIEAQGILTFRRPDLKQFRVRGFCLWTTPLPIIVVGSEAPTAQFFTLAHELAHVVLRQSAISGVIPRTGGDPTKRRIEEWCDQFASAFLMPRASVWAFLAPPARPMPAIEDVVLAAAAGHFGVSEHAMLVRLVTLRYVSEDYYWSVKKPFFDAQARQKTFGRPKYYGTRFRGSLGDLYTGLVLEAWSNGRIAGHHAAEYMGIKNLQHMYAIRDHYGDG